MLELTIRKNKINLADYNYQQDIESRILLSDFDLFDREVLEEILFSPLKISVKKLSRSLNCQELQLKTILQKLSRSGLLQYQDDTLVVDKERRKYFEFQMSRFEKGFKPDMEFLQGLLKQVPIHVLPSWYAIPRSSNNIFESIVEKYLLTPQIYQRYLMEINFSDPILSGIMADVFASPDLRVASSDLIAKYNLARPEFEQLMLQLEFNFVCFVTYTEENEWVVPFHEWGEYLLFLRQTEPPQIDRQESIFRHRPNDFAFVEDMGSVLLEAKKKQLMDPLSPAALRHLSERCAVPIGSPDELAFAQEYFSKILNKLQLVKLLENVNGRLHITDGSADWLSFNLENRALHLYRHPLNKLTNPSVPSQLATEKNLREAEKSIKRVLHGGWILFEDFLKGAITFL